MDHAIGNSAAGAEVLFGVGVMKGSVRCTTIWLNRFYGEKQIVRGKPHSDFKEPWLWFGGNFRNTKSSNRLGCTSMGCGFRKCLKLKPPLWRFRAYATRWATSIGTFTIGSWKIIYRRETNQTRRTMSPKSAVLSKNSS